MSVNHYKARVAKKQKLTDKVFYLSLELEEPKKLNFLAGQCFSIKVPGNLRRLYSFSNGEHESSFIETYADITPNGPGSKYIKKLKIKDEVEVMGPFGHFIFMDQPAVFLATGTGIVPYLSMLTTLAKNKITKHQIKLYWGLRYEKDVFALEQLNNFKKILPNFNFQICLSQSTKDWEGRKGYCTSCLIEDWQAIEEVDKNDFYICGSGNFISDAVDLLDEHEIVGSVYFEKFY